MASFKIQFRVGRTTRHVTADDELTARAVVLALTESGRNAPVFVNDDTPANAFGDVRDHGSWSETLPVWRTEHTTEAHRPNVVNRGAW